MQVKRRWRDKLVKNNKGLLRENSREGKKEKESASYGDKETGKRSMASGERIGHG